MHVIPWKLLCQGITPANPALGADAPVGIKPKLLRLLVEAAVSNQNFDEASYLKANPDVAAAVRAGKLRSGRDHYIDAGYFEGRSTGAAGFDEAWYLQRYPDVLQAVKRGGSANGLEHFHGPGMLEWRSPTKDAEADIARWRSVIDPPKPVARPVAGTAPASSAGTAPASSAGTAAASSAGTAPASTTGSAPTPPTGPSLVSAKPGTPPNRSAVRG